MGPKQPKQPKQQWRVVFKAKGDNHGKAAWRQHHPPVDNVLVPVRFAANDNHHFNIAQKHKIWLSLSKDRRGDCLVYNMWGKRANVLAAKADITGWIKRLNKNDGIRRDSFAKVYSLTEKQRTRAEKQWEEDVKRALFGQHPPPGMAFRAIGSFHWPVEEYPPQIWLGEDFEALDSIRMDCSSYVVFDEERKSFLVMGKADKVRDGLQRLRTACLQIMMMGTIVPEAKHFLHWPRIKRAPAHVVMVDHRGPVSKNSNGVTSSTLDRSPRALGSKPQETDENWRETTSNYYRLKSIVLKKLNDLRYLRGEIDMTLRLGTFLATATAGQSHLSDKMYSLPEYTKMTTNNEFVAKVSENIGDITIEKSLHSALQQSGLIVPADALTNRVEDVEPVYGASFRFLDDEDGDLWLDVTWQKAIDSYSKAEFDMVSSRWTRCSREGPTKVLEASLTNLQSGLAWLFDIQAREPIDESTLAPSRKAFLSGLELDPPALSSTGMDKMFVKYSSMSDLKFVQQRKDYIYNVLSCDYKLKVSCFRNHRLRHEHLGKIVSDPTLFEASWKLEVSRTKWATMFTEISQLDIGRLASWNNTVDVWFESDSGDDGWAQLMDELCKVEKIVSGLGRRHDVPAIL